MPSPGRSATRGLAGEGNLKAGTTTVLARTAHLGNTCTGFPATWHCTNGQHDARAAKTVLVPQDASSRRSVNICNVIWGRVCEQPVNETPKVHRHCVLHLLLHAETTVSRHHQRRRTRAPQQHVMIAAHFDVHVNDTKRQCAAPLKDTQVTLKALHSVSKNASWAQHGTTNNGSRWMSVCHTRCTGGCIARECLSPAEVLTTSRL